MSIINEEINYINVNNSNYINSNYIDHNYINNMVSTMNEIIERTSIHEKEINKLKEINDNLNKQISQFFTPKSKRLHACKTCESF